MRRNWIGILILILILVLLAAAPGWSAELRAGVGRADLTPPIGTPLSGYAARKGAPSTGVHDLIQARALVLEAGELRLGILTADLIGCDPTLVEEVAQQASFPAEQLMVCMSHTHSGPGAFSKAPFAQIVGGPYNAEVRRKLVAGLSGALRQAAGNLVAARVGVGERTLPDFQRNRRKARVVDPALWVLRVDTVDRKPLAAVVNLTAHGTVLEAENLEFSADWMGFTREWLEKEVPGLTVLYTNGAEGDVSPNIPRGGSNFEGARNLGGQGGRAALALYQDVVPRTEATLETRTTGLVLPRTFRAGLLGAGTGTRLQWFRIGDALLIAVPGEMITQLGLLLKEQARRAGVLHPVIMGLANDHLGYFLTRAEMKKGGYEAGVSFFGDDFGETLTRALAGLIGGDLKPFEAELAAANAAAEANP